MYVKHRAGTIRASSLESRRRAAQNPVIARDLP
jgi:hypothetical protein